MINDRIIQGIAGWVIDPTFTMDITASAPSNVQRRYQFGDPLIREIPSRERTLPEAAA